MSKQKNGRASVEVTKKGALVKVDVIFAIRAEGPFVHAFILPGDADPHDRNAPRTELCRMSRRVAEDEPALLDDFRAFSQRVFEATMRGAFGADTTVEELGPGKPPQ